MHFISNFKFLGALALVLVFGFCVASDPVEVNKLLGIQSLSAAGERLNGPNDITLLIRAVVGLGLGMVACVGVWSVQRRLRSAQSK
ncbi:hypothetical protein ABGT16_04205 [Pseudomonas asiatica]|uniref:hypothetical protein n=1 Tax=Pseudomonas TaxID=286 RepID=UPI001BAFA79D|nr:hypothetical protein [Pseudomonas putida]QUG93311.1 hypothetical protein GR140_31715 [Pseudomonas putida]